MSTPSIRAALEQWRDLAQADLLCPANPAETDWGAVAVAIAATLAALDEPDGEGPSAADLLPVNPPNIPTTIAMQYRSAWREGVEDGWNEARAVLARWGRPTAPPAPEAGEGGSDYDQEGAIAAVILDHSRIAASLGYPDPERNLGRVLRESDFGATARAILARWGRPATPPAPEGEEVGELVQWIHREAIHGPDGYEWRRAATLLQQLSPPAPAVVPVAHDGPADPAAQGEVDELVAALEQDADRGEQFYDLCNTTAKQFARAATLLQQQQHLLGLACAELDRLGAFSAAPAPAPKPIPVSERLPDPRPEAEGGDCDDDGFCWFGYGYRLPGEDEKDSYAMWMLMPPEESRYGEVWVRASAIPLPQAGEGEA